MLRHSLGGAEMFQLLCILTSEQMLAHAFVWSKTIKNTRKLVKSVYYSTLTSNDV